MTNITNYISRLFKKAKTANCKVKPEETIDGQAFVYKSAPLNRVHHVFKDQQAIATISTFDGEKTITDKATAEVKEDMRVNHIAIFKMKEAFGMTDVVGMAFGYKEQNEA